MEKRTLKKYLEHS